MKKNILVVGSGLAGICVSIQLIKKNQQVTLIHNGVNYSSVVAAGQINPMVFRRMTKSWRLDEFTQYLEEFYTNLEQETQSSFFHPITIRRMFSSEQERDFWIEKQDKLEFQEYLYKITPEDENFNKAPNEFGSGRVKHSSYVNTATFLNKTLNWISERAIILNENFDYNSCNPNLGKYKENIYDEIVFCQGAQNNENPWFGDLPIDHTKGEVLTIKSNHIPEGESLNRKCFILPIGENTFRMGATYVWKTNDLSLTEEGKNEILEKSKFLTKESFEILEQKAGIRPTTRDRRPLIGRHPVFEKLSIFNGLGTKGYMIAPKLSEEFVDFLIEGKALDKEVQLVRYNNLLNKN